MLGVDYIEAGFPVSSPGDFEAVKQVARHVKGPGVCGLARALEKDIDAAYNAVKYSARPRIHVFLATSKIHMKYKLKKAEDEILKLAVAAVKYARSKCADIEFSPEDASRTERAFLHRVVGAVIDAGARTVNIPDTVGYAVPSEFAEVISGIAGNVPNIDRCVISVHCHNDLGLAVSNSLAAVQSGARQVECTMNGLGERAGNASLEEIVMAIRTRGDAFRGFATGIDTKEIYKTSRLVSKLTGMPVQPNKAIIGANAFAHESGIHQDWVLKERITYEIMKPEDVGFEESKIVLGKHSGRHAFATRLKRLGLELKPGQLDQAFERFKKLADKKKEIFDSDLETIVDEEISKIPERFKLVHFHITSGDEVKPAAVIKMTCAGKAVESRSTGDGPVDACYRAIDRVAGQSGSLIDYQIRSVTSGKDSLGEVTVKVQSRGAIVSGRGSSTDIIEASIKAYVNAINKLASKDKP